MAVLRDAAGNHDFPLGEKITLVGRDPGCDIVLLQNRASPRHALILHLAGIYYIKDLDSIRGTVVNGRRISERTRLKSGDCIELGGTTLTFHEGEPSGHSTRAPAQRVSAPPAGITSSPD